MNDGLRGAVHASAETARGQTDVNVLERCFEPLVKWTDAFEGSHRRQDAMKFDELARFSETLALDDCHRLVNQRLRFNKAALVCEIKHSRQAWSAVDVDKALGVLEARADQRPDQGRAAGLGAFQ